MSADAADADDFHLSDGWSAHWRAAYVVPGMMPVVLDGLPLIAERVWLGPLAYRILRSQTNVHTPRLDLPADCTITTDLASRLLGCGRPDMVMFDYVPAGSRLMEVAETWRGRHRVTIAPHAHAPATDCRRDYAAWLAARSKRSRVRWPKLEQQLIGELGMHFEQFDGRDGSARSLDAVLDEIFTVEQSGWKGKAGTAIRDSAADTMFYTSLARTAAAAGALRIAMLRHHGRVVAFEYGIVGGDRLFLLKVGFDEAYESHSIGHVLATLNIRHCCDDPAIAWYDKLGNGLTPAAYKLRFADTIDVLYRITLYSAGWRGWMLRLHDTARGRAKAMRDRWWPRAAAAGQGAAAA